MTLVVFQPKYWWIISSALFVILELLIIYGGIFYPLADIYTAAKRRLIRSTAIIEYKVSIFNKNGHHVFCKLLV